MRQQVEETARDAILVEDAALIRMMGMPALEALPSRAVPYERLDPLILRDDDRTQRLIEHDPENFEIRPGASERYTLIEITAFPGRSATAKRCLYEAIVHNLETAGVPADDISVVLHEPPMENWGIRGGKPASEVDLGYRVDV